MGGCFDPFSFDMLDAPIFAFDQELGNHQSVAIRHPFLGTHETKRFGQVAKPRDQQVTSPLNKCAVRRAPVFEVAEHIAEFKNRCISDPAIGEQSSDPLVGRSRLDIGADTGPIGMNPHVGHRPNPMKDQEAAKLGRVRPPYPMV